MERGLFTNSLTRTAIPNRRPWPGGEVIDQAARGRETNDQTCP